MLRKNHILLHFLPLGNHSSLWLFTDSWGQMHSDLPQAGSDKCKPEESFRVTTSGYILPLTTPSPVVSNSSSHRQAQLSLPSVKEPAGLNILFSHQQLLLFSPNRETTQWNFIGIWIFFLKKSKLYKSFLSCLRFVFVIFSSILNFSSPNCHKKGSNKVLCYSEETLWLVAFSKEK